VACGHVAITGPINVDSTLSLASYLYIIDQH